MKILVNADQIKSGDIVVFRNDGKSVVHSIEPAIGYENFRRYIRFENCNLGIVVAMNGHLITKELNQPTPNCPFDIVGIL